MYDKQRIRVSLDCGDEIITKQSHKAECDINNILKQYQRTGIITHVQNARADYTDLPSDVDYQNSLNILLQADETFAALPAAVRQYFNNDPSAFLGSFADPTQADKLREFGLLKPVEASAAPAAVTSPAAPSKASGDPS